MNLWADFLNNDKRVIHKLKNYFPIYERHFKDFVYKPVTVIEIGCGEGGSLQMWKRYFGPYAHIVGIDIRPECKTFEEDQISIYIGDQSDPDLLHRVIGDIVAPDVVIDDGSHMMSDMSYSFNFLYPCMSKHGVYMVEDLCCAYWREFDGGNRDNPANFIECTKHLIDQLNADHTRGDLQPSDFTRSTVGIHIYDSAVVFERGTHTPNIPLKTGH